MRRMFEKPSRDDLLAKLLSLENPFETLKDQSKVNGIAEAVPLIRDKEDLEFFTATYLLVNFYPDAEKICFKMKDKFDPRKDDISTTGKLKELIKENDLSDFGIMNNKGELRDFQLKYYDGPDNTESLFNFLRAKLEHYSLDVGATNFLIILRSNGILEGNIFHELHARLCTMNLKGTGHILIAYNEEGKFDVINTIFPELGTTRIPYRKLSERLAEIDSANYSSEKFSK